MEKFIKSCEKMLDRMADMELEAIIEALSPLPPEIESLTGDEVMDLYVSQLQEGFVPEA